MTLTTDDSNIGWGTVLGENDTGGLWSPMELEFHINYLEMKAVLLGLKSLCKDCHDVQICVQSDNTTTLIRWVVLSQKNVMIWHSKVGGGA